jgi:type I restriction enzyme M protein
MNQNPKIPQLFRDIFKNAYLPYRDPETLKSFLKEINTFHYSHSEKLGDAFEYLLSVLGSQGDAGQFRTPRHLIDFMAEIVAPQKGETILDPACGTAGFLVAAYKYILKTNMDKRPGDLLSPDDRKRFVENFNGYDISPDMVRLSLVNLYLHGFSEPHVYEYDTLTSEDHWGEGYDIVLANPPFMSPKGGIKPHKRFAIQAKRSEVLFVDYIAEHLNPQGRAAVIVPEGIIFQTQTAYKDLRRMLLDGYLWGVISLPAGVFQPYSGVKTSILLMDKRLVKRSENVIFLKLDNDGYGLGAQRREIELNDLPKAIEIINAYKSALFSGVNYEIPEQYQNFAHIITKSKIAEKGDYILSGERYRVNEEVINEKYKFIELHEICTVLNGKAYKQEELLNTGKYPVLRVGNFFSNRDWYYSDLELEENKYCDNGDLLYAWSASFGPKIWNGGKVIFHYHIWKMIPNEEIINKIFLYHVLNRETESIKADGGRGIAMIHITKSDFEQRLIPIPPLPIQEQIVSEIENYQKIIDGAKQIVENWKPQIKIKEEWEVKELGEVCENFKNGVNFSAEQVGYGTKFVNIKDLFNDKTVNLEYLEKVNITENEIAKTRVKNNDILFVRSSVKYEGAGFPSIIQNIKNEDIVFCGFIIKCSPIQEIVNSEFLLFLLRTDTFRKQTIALSNKANITNISQDNLKTLKIPIPSLTEQESIVKAIEEERAIVENNKRLIEIFEQKIKLKIAEVWGE